MNSTKRKTSPEKGRSLVGLGMGLLRNRKDMEEFAQKHGIVLKTSDEMKELREKLSEEEILEPEAPAFRADFSEQLPIQG
jgi:hypothetical protein